MTRWLFMAGALLAAPACLAQPLMGFEEDGARPYSTEVGFDGPGQRNWRAGRPAQILLP